MLWSIVRLLGLTIPIYAALEAKEEMVIHWEAIRCYAVTCISQAVAASTSTLSVEWQRGDAEQVIPVVDISQVVVLWDVKVGADRTGLVKFAKLIQSNSFEYLSRSWELAVWNLDAPDICHGHVCTDFDGSELVGWVEIEDQVLVRSIDWLVFVLLGTSEQVLFLEAVNSPMPISHRNCNGQE